MSNKGHMTHDAAVGVVRDVLEERGAEADAVLAEVLGARSTVPKVAGPLTTAGQTYDREVFFSRSSLEGPLGTVTRRVRATGTAWRWTAHEVATRQIETFQPSGEHPTLREADAAFTAALRGYGWTCMVTPETLFAKWDEGAALDQAITHCREHRGHRVWLVVANHDEEREVRNRLDAEARRVAAQVSVYAFPNDEGQPSHLHVLSAARGAQWLTGGSFHLCIVTCSLPPEIEREIRTRAGIVPGEVRWAVSAPLTLTDRGTPVAQSTDGGSTWTPVEST